MTLDRDQLSRVFEARERFERLEDSLWEARGTFHREIRALHAASGSMREVADALGMSHQRVHQIIGEEAVVEVHAAEATSVVRFDESTTPTVAEDACSFCSSPRREVDRLLAAPGGRFICGSCVERATAVVAGAVDDGAPLVASEQPCSFCGRTGNSAASNAEATVTICDRCVAASQRIVSPDGAEPKGGRRREIPMRCSFCNASQREVAKLIAGPNVYVCNDCVVTATEVVATRSARTGPRQVSMGTDGRPCAFCSKRAADVDVVVRGGRGHICNECVALCTQIIEEDEAD